MNKFLLTFSLIALAGSLASPALAAKSNSEKLQNKLDNFEDTLSSISDDINDVRNLDLEPGDDTLHPDRDLAQLKYDAAFPLLEDAIVQTKKLLTITTYINGIPSNDKKATLITFEKLIAQFQTYQDDLDDGMTLANDDETESQGLSAVENAVGTSRSYISGAKDDPHVTIEKYLKNFDNSSKENYTESLAAVQSTYDLYKVKFSQTEIQTFKSQFTSASAYYSDGLALYNRGVAGDEQRDLQLLNRGAKKFVKSRYWLKQIYNTVLALSLRG